ncbi:MAG: hypothetical protein RLZZ127_213 [Planctomycetota bacterium]|jgi:Ca-activated chloride channel family protein
MRTLIVIVFVLACVAVAVAQFAGSPAPAGAVPGPGPGSDPGPAPGAVRLVVGTSSAKKAWMEAAAKAFAATRSGVEVRLVHGNSGDQMREILDGTFQPALWSPGDESWIALANDAWKGQHGAPLFAASRPLTRVPLVIAMWEPMAQALGHPAPIGWADLAALARDPRGWAAKGHPEWGAFTWGHAHPDANSGFLTMVSMIYAAAGKTSRLTVEDLRDPAVRERVKVLEHSVEHYGLSNSFIDELMRTRGPAYLSAAAQYENAVIEGNLRTGGRPFPLVAVYPREGMVVATHPAAIPEAPWVGAAERAEAEAFIAFLTSDRGRRLAVEAGIRPAGGEDDPGAPFTSANGAAGVLPAVPVLEIPGDAILRRVRDLWFESKKPASVTLVIDTSGSMNGEPMTKAKEGAVGFLDTMYAGDEVEIIAFSDRVVPVVPMGRVSEVRESARARIQGLFANGGTHLHDVIITALKRIAERRAAQPDRHYGIVVLTDGRDEGSRASRADLVDELPSGDRPGAVKVFTIGYGENLDKVLLREVATRTGARFFESTPKTILQVYQELSANF